MRRILAPFVTLVSLVLAFATAAAARADGLIIVPPRPHDAPHLRNLPLAVRSHRVTVTVEDRVAVTEVDQVFVNPNPRALEGTYLFPLPVGAAIDRFSMWVDGKELAAELLDAGKARDIYEGIVRQMRDPALLEYADRGLFKARIFPIDANGEKRVRIRYAELLTADSGTVAYRYPLATERFSSKPLEECSIAVSIEAGSPIAAVWSPSHKVDAPATTPNGGPTRVRIGWEARNTLPDRDFLLYWRPTRKDVGIAALAHRDASDAEGTFLLVLSAMRQRADEAPMPKDVVFVLDTSGSMAGAKMEQARGALRFCVRSLAAGDRFGIVPFATEPRPFASGLSDATQESRAAAEKFIDGLEARGGTAIDDALRTAFAQLPADAAGRPQFVVFLTDGLPTIGQTDAAVITKNAVAAARGARVFAFGVGNDVNTKLLDVVAEETRGTRDYVAESESIEEKVSNLWTKVSKPALTDVAVRIDGVATSAVHPQRLPDLFHGTEILVAGRYASGGNAVVRLTGKVRGQPVEVVEELKLPDAEAKHEFLPRLWAVRRVGFLLDEIRLRGESAEVKDEVVRLAKRFGIVTPYTSYLIVEDQQRRVAGERPAFDRRHGDLPGDPFGWTAGGDSGGAAPPAGGGGVGGGGAPAASAPAAPPELLDGVRREAAKARSAAEKDSGDGAVGLSLETKRLKEYEGRQGGDDEAGAGSLLRHVEGRTFARRGELWWDLRADPAKARRKVVEFSDEYFALVRANPDVAKYLTLGRVVIVVGDEVVEVVPE